MQGAKSSVTPFISFFLKEEIIALATKAGLKDADQGSAEKYFAGAQMG